jgi:hypothetical protein
MIASLKVTCCLCLTAVSDLDSSLATEVQLTHQHLMDTPQLVANVNLSPLFQHHINGNGNEIGKESDTSHSCELPGFAITPPCHWSTSCDESAPIPAERRSKKKRVHVVRDQLGRPVTRPNGVHHKRAADDIFSEEDVEDEHITANGIMRADKADSAVSVESDVAKSAEETKPYVNYIVDELVDTEEIYVKELGEVVEVCAASI